MDIRSLKFVKNKKLVVATVAAVCMLGTGIAAAAGAVSADKADAVQTDNDSAAPAVKAESVQEEEEEQQELEGLIRFRKAGIEEYDMDMVAPGERLDVKPTEDIKKSVAITAVKTFTVSAPADSSTVLKPAKTAASNPGTRSVASEYYTVYDERSGCNVTLNGHELLCRMVNSEIGDSWGEEAIKAQVVAAYSYLRFNDAMGSIPTVGLRDGYSSKLENCVNAVEGQCVYYNGSIINAVYSASSAGASAPSEKIWGVAYPYLRAVESKYDSKDPNYGVTKTFTAEQLKDIIEKNTGIKLSNDPQNWFEIQSVFSYKYVDLMKLDGNEYINVNGAKRRVTGALMRSTILGYSNLKSTAFDITYDNGLFTFKTYGWGHGVGMSQWGACYYAQAGYTYDQILRHYYTNTVVAVSSVNEKAVERSKMTKEQLAAQAQTSQQAQPASEAPAAEPATTDESSVYVADDDTRTDEQPSDTEQTTQPAETTPAQEETAADEQPAEETPAQTEESSGEEQSGEVLPDDTEYYDENTEV